LLISESWPSYLLIFQGLYLQSVLYTDAIQGLVWYIVVLLPAEIQPDHLDSSSAMYYVVIAVASLSLCVGCTCLLITVIYRKNKVMKFTQPVFTIMVLLGGMVRSVSCFLLLGPNNTANCTVRPYLFHLSFTFTFAPLLIKSWRVHVIFNLNPLKKTKLISTYVLVLYTMAFVLVDLIILVSSLYGGGKGTKPTTSTVLTSNGAYAQLTFCGYHNNSALFFSELVYKGMLVATACYLSFKTRNVAGLIAGSKVLLVTVYNVAFTSGVIILITHSLSAVDTVVISEAMGICFCVITTAVLLVAPIYYSILFVGEDAVFDDVMDEVMRKKPERGSASSAQDLAKSAGKPERGSASSVPDPRKSAVKSEAKIETRVGWGVSLDQTVPVCSVPILNIL